MIVKYSLSVDVVLMPLPFVDKSPLRTVELTIAMHLVSEPLSVVYSFLRMEINTLTMPKSLFHFSCVATPHRLGKDEVLSFVCLIFSNLSLFGRVVFMRIAAYLCWRARGFLFAGLSSCAVKSRNRYRFYKIPARKYYRICCWILDTYFDVFCGFAVSERIAGV